jgi:hypothetical protein
MAVSYGGQMADFFAVVECSPEKQLLRGVLNADLH